jgi:hypothetical protein
MRSYLILSTINGLLLLLLLLVMAIVMLLGLLRTAVGLTAAVDTAAACQPAATHKGQGRVGKRLGYSMRGMFSGSWIWREILRKGLETKGKAAHVVTLLHEAGARGEGGEDGAHVVN